jgi:hypothetical protein
MHMTFRKKHIAGIAAVGVAVAYALTSWRGNSEDIDEQAPATEHQAPTDD